MYLALELMQCVQRNLQSQWGKGA